jgi:hypothetical protein
MSIKIEKQIVDYEVVDDKASKGVAEAQQQPAMEERSAAQVIQMHEKVERPETLRGSTYKVKTPLSEHALYLTINDIILNEGTEHELRRPFEIFINSKNMDHFQWIVALTRIISAVFRKGGDVTFLVVKTIGLLKGDELDEHQQKLIAEKRAAFEAAEAAKVAPAAEADSDFPDGATLCAKCQTKAMIQMDGCLTLTCLNCGESKCG